MRPTARVAPAVGVVAAVAAYHVGMSTRGQVLGPFPYAARTAEKVIALTFDDGPNEPYTSDVADILAERGIRATFFQVGACVERRPDVTRRLVDDGHVVGNHSWSHQLHRCPWDSVMRGEIRRTQSLIEATTGSRPTLYRPPWLLRTPALFRTLAREGLRPRSGEFCHALEPLQPPAAWIARRALAKSRPGAVLIFHDGFDARGGDRGNTVAAVRTVADRLIDEGYTFATLADEPFAGA